MKAPMSSSRPPPSSAAPTIAVTIVLNSTRLVSENIPIRSSRKARRDVSGAGNSAGGAPADRLPGGRLQSLHDRKDELLVVVPVGAVRVGWDVLDLVAVEIARHDLGEAGRRTEIGLGDRVTLAVEVVPAQLRVVAMQVAGQPARGADGPVAARPVPDATQAPRDVQPLAEGHQRDDGWRPLLLRGRLPERVIGQGHVAGHRSSRVRDERNAAEARIGHAGHRLDHPGAHVGRLPRVEEQDLDVARPAGQQPIQRRNHRGPQRLDRDDGGDGADAAVDHQRADGQPGQIDRVAQRLGGTDRRQRRRAARPEPAKHLRHRWRLDRCGPERLGQEPVLRALALGRRDAQLDGRQLAAVEVDRAAMHQVGRRRDRAGVAVRPASGSAGPTMTGAWRRESGSRRHGRRPRRGGRRRRTRRSRAPRSRPARSCPTCTPASLPTSIMRAHDRALSTLTGG